MKKGFTLAETLIALAIIGVIAAISIFPVLNHYKKTQVASRLKKFYSEMSQAIQLSEYENGPVEYWEKPASNCTDSEEIGAYFLTYIAPYYKYTGFELSIEEDPTSKVTKPMIRISLIDGSSVKMYSGDCMDLVFDINGGDAPNEAGRDLFDFSICPAGYSFKVIKDGKLVPACGSGCLNNREKMLSYCQTRGDYCSALIMFDNWQIKSDYPYKL